MKSIIRTSAGIIKSVSIMIIFFALACSALADGPLIEFDDVASSTSSAANTSNPNYTYAERSSGADSWTSTAEIGTTGNYQRFYRFINTANNDHIGWGAFGYLDMSSTFSHDGNSLHARITGGKNSDFVDGSGAVIYSKQDFVDYSGDPNSGEVLGQPYIYFSTTDGTHSEIFPNASGADELSIYLYLADTLSADSGSSIPNQTISIGPYLSGASSHYYHRAYISGGGWVHFVVDNHPNHYNSYGSCDNFPVTGCAFNTFASADYVQQFSHLYIAIDATTTPSDYYIDDMEFRSLSGETDQNFETLNSPAIGYYPDGHFELSLYDKYRDEVSGMTVELRYSSSPITNANWSSATLADIQEYSGGFTITEVAPGQFRKPNRYYRNVWAPFRLQPSDEASLDTGDTVYFAFKDVGNLDGNGNPIQTCSDSGCRDYTSGNFDWVGDSAVLPNIRTIDYVVNLSNQQSIIQPVVNLEIIQ
ncbi:MAG: hypothetical protein PF692_05435 [Kiritimatiellae bacterium]|jgi:hypothetical protein|nr:hypothetical protein [Kiritimatiellia bacterium]